MSEKEKPSLSKEQKKLAKEYAKRTKAVLKELKKMFQPKSIKERIPYNLMMNTFIGQLTDVIKEEDPAKTRVAIETLIKRLLWIIQ